MNKDLLESFHNACKKAKVINDLPNLTDEQYEQIFYHVSNEDMVTTIRTINHAYTMVKKLVDLK
ncbi:MAG: hypothetical protein WCQ67_08850 [Treponema sp.]